MRLIQLGLAAFVAIGTTTAAPSALRADAGAYLAAQASSSAYAFEDAQRYLDRALDEEPYNPRLLEARIQAAIGMGAWEEAVPFAQRLDESGQVSQIATITLMVDATLNERWDDLFALLESGRTAGSLVDGLMQAWALYGEGRVQRSLEAFDDVIAARGLRSYGLYHKALALAAVGDLEGAEAIFALPASEGMQPTLRSVQAHAEILSQLGRTDAAIAMIDGMLGSNPVQVFVEMRAALEAGETLPRSFARNAKEGIAEVLFNVSAVLQDENDPAVGLIYARGAEAIWPDHVHAITLAAQYLERLDRYALAIAAYEKVPENNPTFAEAQMARAEALRRSGEAEAGITALTELAATFPERALVQAALGDALRWDGQMAEAEMAYSRALEQFEGDHPSKWFVLYTRGITRERQGKWPEAEADFRASLDLNPDHPSVLNYLGYSLVEKQTNLEEALGMIETAVAERPQSGAIVDSLGWAQFRLGRYDEAVKNLERAAELEPVDPIITDHLGDALWAVGREIEAQFQWRRALSFEPEEAEADRIRRKLEVGLDAVLAEEGADPLERGDDAD